MTTVPSQDFDVICGLLCGMFITPEVRTQVVARARQHDVGGGDILERIFAGERSAEIYPEGRLNGDAPGLLESTDAAPDGHFTEEVQIDGTAGFLHAQAEFRTIGPDGEQGEATPVPLRVIRDSYGTPALEGDLVALVAVLRGEHPEDSGESYGRRKTPDPFDPPGEAILVRNAPGLSATEIIRAVGQERVDECSFLGVENPDRTVRVIKMLNEPSGRNMACAPRSFIPPNPITIDLMEAECST